MKEQGAATYKVSDYSAQNSTLTKFENVEDVTCTRTKALRRPVEIYGGKSGSTHVGKLACRGSGATEEMKCQR